TDINGGAGLAGVRLTLTGTNKAGQSVFMTAVTGADGSYSFAGLLDGTYTITETTTAPGYAPFSSSVGTVNGMKDGTMVDVTQLGGIALQAGQNGIHYDFTEINSVPPPGPT